MHACASRSPGYPGSDDPGSVSRTTKNGAWTPMDPRKTRVDRNFESNFESNLLFEQESVFCWKIVQSTVCWLLSSGSEYTVWTKCASVMVSLPLSCKEFWWLCYHVPQPLSEALQACPCPAFTTCKTDSCRRSGDGGELILLLYFRSGLFRAYGGSLAWTGGVSVKHPAVCIGVRCSWQALICQVVNVIFVFLSLEGFEDFAPGAGKPGMCWCKARENHATKGQRSLADRHSKWKHFHQHCMKK